MDHSAGNFHGVITLDGEEIGRFEINPTDVTATLNRETSDLGDTLDFAAENGMQLCLVLEPDFEDYVPAHRKELASPK